MADIKINGNRPWDIVVRNPRFYERVLGDGLLGLGESYMDGDWDCKKLDELAYRAFSAKLDEQVRKLSWHDKLQGIRARITNMQTKRRSYEVGRKHYDVGNDLYELMLDKWMIYSCGYWRNGARNLDEAQEAKLDLSCRKIGLKANDSVLDIGCGWGGFLMYAAEKFQAKGVGISVSKEQVDYAKAKSKGMPVEIRFQDYRDPIVDEKGKPKKFDHVVSYGMVEHVGPKNYRAFMEVVAKHLNPQALFLLQTIGQPTSRITNDPWTHKYIFPNSQAPSIAQLARAAEGIFAVEDIHVFGTDYDKTVIEWYKNFTWNWDKIKNIRDESGNIKYDNRFRRMWNYGLLGVAGMFRSQNASLWQIVFSFGDIPGGYRSIR